ncbi:cupin domain-containing protein [Dactylosporangium sp. CA-092794]|uniref:cupin domain-containing protein n=1 Tax=Dactylosporangium sp. CA-092794 TaxID=3239929 RepID=UPI003D8C5B37
MGIMTATGPDTGASIAAIGSLDELYAFLSDHAYEALWTMENALTRQPVTTMRPYIWRYRQVRDLIMRAGDLISVAEADRRVLAFRNPGFSGRELARATDTLWAAVQMVLPGEAAPPHRHTPSALRFIIEGEGAYTIVDGARVQMEAGDFLITPNWSWHEHGHDGAGAVIWLDGLDSPMVSTLRQMFAEFEGAPQSKTHVYSDVLRSGYVEPSWMDRAVFSTLVWKLDDTLRAIEELRGEQGDPYDDVIVEYRNPQTGGPALPTMSAFMQLLRPGAKTWAHRQTSSTVYHVVRGTGYSVLDGQRFEWEPGDTFAVPTWVSHAHANPTSGDALLFSFSDEPAVRALGLYREQKAA